MGTRDAVVEIDSLEKGLLPINGSSEDTAGASGEDSESETALYTASFNEMEENFVKYQTALWVMYSLLFILAWGIGLFMLLYLPVRRYILRKDIRSRKLYVTSDAIVYKVTKPVPFPCFGVLKREKYVLLPSLSDVVIEQGYLQSLFGVYSVRFENAGARRPASDDVQIQGISNPDAFKKTVLAQLSRMRKETFSRQISSMEDASLRTMSPRATLGSSSSFKYDPSPTPGEVILLQKLEEVGNSLKRLQSIVEEQNS